MERCLKESFAVIGKEGATSQGNGFVQRLWQDANGHFEEIAQLASRDDSGRLLGIWGAMSDLSRAFLPWTEDFSTGLYLAGVECPPDAQPPAGWSKWIIPGYEYLYRENDGPQAFSLGLEELRQAGCALAGAVQDFNCPESGRAYLFYPIRRL